MDKKCNWIVGLYTLIFGLTFGLECLIFKHKMVSFWIGEVFFALSTGGDEMGRVRYSARDGLALEKNNF